MGNLNGNKPPMVGPWSQIERLKLNKILLFSRKEFQVFKNVSFDPRAIAYFVMTQNTRLPVPF